MITDQKDIGMAESLCTFKEIYRKKTKNGTRSLAVNMGNHQLYVRVKGSNTYTVPLNISYEWAFEAPLVQAFMITDQKDIQMAESLCTFKEIYRKKTKNGTRSLAVNTGNRQLYVRVKGSNTYAVPLNISYEQAFEALLGEV